LLGILASDLINFYYRSISSSYRGGYLRFIYQYLETIPIAVPDDKSRKLIESNVQKILEAKNQNPEADTTELEEEIDRLVYELYGLSEEEIGVVENQ
jgi:adenine-specific DNA-methyltransferase